MDLPLDQVRQALRDDDAAGLRRLLAAHPPLRALLASPGPHGDGLAIACVRSREMLDVFLEAGADIDAKTDFWAGGFGLLHLAPPELASYAVTRGATVDVHAAARLGMVERLRELLAADPSLVSSRGGDGQTPLHFASTCEVAALLLDAGADLEARDVDHESTPAQYMVRDRQEVLRLLLRRGCRADLFLAAALGDLELIRRLLDEDPGAIRRRVSEEHFPMVGGHTGGTIYQWMLGWHVSPHEVARSFGHEEAFRLLMERSPEDIQLVVGCWLGDAAAVGALVASHPGIVSRLEAPERRQIAHAARNDDLSAVRLMAELGLPLDARGQHGGTPLHWAAWHGNLPAVRLLLGRGAPLELLDHDFKGTPLRWAIHGSENGWHRERGDYPGTVAALLDAGAVPPAAASGTDAVRAVLRARGVS